MTHELAKELKDAGFPQREGRGVKHPTLSELIEACGDKFYGLHRMVNGEWLAFMYDIEDSTRQVETIGSMPEEAVAHLWLALNKK